MFELTSKIVYEYHRRFKLEGKTRNTLIYFITTVLSLSSIAVILLFQFNFYTRFTKNERNNSNNVVICNRRLVILNIDLLSTCFSIFLLILYAIIYKRRNFLRNKFKCTNLGLPMVISCWKKVIN